MRFGDYIRDVRRQLNWTQPEAAREIGIEQSYLSKLESGKSYPSEDVFSSIIGRYSIDVSTLNQSLFPAELDRLRDITQVREFILKSEQQQAKRAQVLLVSGTVALALGGACLGAASLAKESEDVLYQYRSTGMVTEASNLDQAAGADVSADPAGSTEEAPQSNTEFIFLEDYRDVVFSEDTPDGTQTWRLIGGTTRTVQSPLRWFMIPGAALVFCAIGLFVMSYRYR
ncbi:MAG: helix-turn-helix domain-containing protein [Hyphomonadaceae bacterium]|nr:helix-turn-helix domain-containing protein [Hyphomonadaceae bacterium]